MAETIPLPVKKEGEQSPPSSETPPTPETPVTPGQPIDTTGGVAGAGVPREEFEKLAQFLRDQQQVTQSLIQQNRELAARAARPAEPEVSEDQLNKQVWDKPYTMLQKMIREELSALGKPMNEILGDRRFEKVSKEYEDIWPLIEPTVRNFVDQAKAQGHEVNEQLISVAALSASGAYYRGRLPGVTPPPVRTETPAPVTPPGTPRAPVADPPFMRPSAPRTPNNGEPPKNKREYTEVERRLMRERRMTEEEWDFYISASPTDFLTKDKPKKEGAK